MHQKIKLKEGIFLKSKKWRFGAVLLAIVILTGAVAGVSFAADQVNNAAVEGCPNSGPGGPGGPGPDGQGPGGHGPNMDSMASILGITVDELRAEMESGKTLEEIVSAYGLTMDQVHEKMLELRKTEIAQAVADGKMTQEQADQMLERLEKGPAGPPPGEPGNGGPGGHGGPGGPNDSTANDSK